MSARQEVGRILDSGDGLIARRDHPTLTGPIAWLARKGDLVTVLPGIYAPPDLAMVPEIRMRAVCLRHPDAVLIAGAAGRASFWPAAPMPEIAVAAPVGIADRPGFAFNRRRIPPALVIERRGLRYTEPALTALDLATFDCADAIDLALRARVTTLSRMYEALRLTANRRGNAERLTLLVDSRNEPWSAAERRSHRILRDAGIAGWEGNWPVVVAGLLYFIDIAFPHLKLAVEIDGRLHETEEDLFESDRWRQNALVADGWRVLRFTWQMLRDHPEAVVAAIHAAIALKS